MAEDYENAKRFLRENAKFPRYFHNLGIAALVFSVLIMAMGVFAVMMVGARAGFIVAAGGFLMAAGEGCRNLSGWMNNVSTTLARNVNDMDVVKKKLGLE